MEKKLLKQKTGTVISDKQKKTVTVLCETRQVHPKYGKVVRAFSKFLVHDENEIAKEGDKVLIQETRPLSTRKHFRVIEVLGKGQAFKRELPKKKEKEIDDTGNEPAPGSR